MVWHAEGAAGDALAVNGDVRQLIALIRRRGYGDERPRAAVRRVDL